MDWLTARKKNKLSQEKLANLCGITKNHYQQIEKGRTNPTLTIALRICSILNICPYDVMPLENLQDVGIPHVCINHHKAVAESYQEPNEPPHR